MTDGTFGYADVVLMTPDEIREMYGDPVPHPADQIEHFADCDGEWPCSCKEES